MPPSAPPPPPAPRRDPWRDAADPWRHWTAGWDVLSAARTGAAGIPALQQQRLGALLAHAAPRSAVVRRMLDGRDPHRVALADLPVMHKRDLMQQFDELVTDPRLRLPELRRFLADPERIGEAYLGEFVVWESSGSSGEPTIFVQDAGAMAVYDALESLRRPRTDPWGEAWRQVLDPFGLRERVAFVGAVGGHFASTVGIERLRRLHPGWADRLRGFSFLQPAADLVAALQAWQPTVVATYPTAAVLLAEAAAAGELTLQLHEVWTGGEALTPAMREMVSQAFGCPVVQTYGASEFLPMAAACPQHALHLNADWVILEPVDAQGRPVAPGEPCHTTLLTNLANRVQPLIRLDLGDRVTFEPGACACGSMLPVISVDGRCDDALPMAAADGTVVRLLPLAVTTVLEDDAGLFDFELRQCGPRLLRLTLAAEGADGRAQLQRGRKVLAAYLAAQGLAGVRIEGRSGVPLAAARSGKRPRVVAMAR